MSILFGDRSLRRSTVIKSIIFIAIGVFALLYVYPSISSAYTETGASLKPVSIQETNYDWPIFEDSETYTEHLDTYFKLYAGQESGRLRVHLPPVPDVAPRTIAPYKYIFEISLQKFEYSTVTHPEDCSLEFFSDNYARILKYQQGTQNYLPLHSSDYARYHCLQVTLKVDRPLRHNPYPRRVFVIKTPIAVEDISNDLEGFPGFSQAVMQNTHYDYRDGLFADRLKDRPRYYAHLDDDFNLYYIRQLDGSFNLRIVLPGHFDIEGSRDINGFSLEYLEYTIVSDRTGCTPESLNDDNGIVRDNNPSPSTSLTPASGDYGKYYCLKVGIKGERTRAFDPNPYRIFYIPKTITDPNPDDIWLYL